MNNPNVQIFFIHSESCNECEKALLVINSAIEKSKIPCNVLKFAYDTDTALKIAVKHNIDDIPGFIIGAGIRVFKGKNYTEKQIIDAIKEAQKHVTISKRK